MEPQPKKHKQTNIQPTVFWNEEFPVWIKKQVLAKFESKNFASRLRVPKALKDLNSFWTKLPKDSSDPVKQAVNSKKVCILIW